jgi:excisionase family DNA binding protein
MQAMVELLDVREAARVLGVGPARVRQLIDQGELEAHRVGRYWAVDPDSVRRRASVNVAHGRPYAPRQVWRMGAMADLAVGNDEGVDVLRKSIRPQARWQLRRYLADLAGDRNPNQVAWRLRSRSDDVLDRYAHPSVLEKLAADPRLVSSGVHAAVLHGSDLVPDDFVDAYVDSADADEVVADYKLIDADDGSNVRLRPVGELRLVDRGLERVAIHEELVVVEDKVIFKPGLSRFLLVPTPLVPSVLQQKDNVAIVNQLAVGNGLLNQHAVAVLQGLAQC